MSNFKHGFYSMNPSINPDKIMIGSAVLGSHALHKLTSLFDEDRLNVGHLYSACTGSGEDLKGYFWGLACEVDSVFSCDTPQSKYANLIGLLMCRIVEFNVYTGDKIRDMVIENPENFSLTVVEFECNSIVTKIKKLRAKF